MKKNERLERMKQEYKNIEIPKELKGKVEQAMKQARQDNQKERVRKKFSKTIGYGAVAAMLAITMLTNTNQKIAYAMADVPVLGAISKVVTFRTYEDENGTMQAKINTPKVEGNSNAVKELNEQMEQYTNKIKEDYEKEVQSVMENFGDTDEGHQAVNTDYEILCDNEKILSIRINTTVVMGGSNIFSKGYTLDKKTGEILELKDLFKEGADYQSILSKEVIRQMREQMKNDESKAYFIDTDMGEEFDFKEIKADQNFFIDKNGKLNLSFDEYEVAPGYMGDCTFVIEKDIIQEILVENSILQK